jgi:hypothetical protein
MNIYYLNNAGSRWIVRDQDGNKPKVKIFGNMDSIVRTALQFRAFGNFAAVQYSFEGKKGWTLDYELVETKKIPNQQLC